MLAGRFLSNVGTLSAVALVLLSSSTGSNAVSYYLGTEVSRGLEDVDRWAKGLTGEQEAPVTSSKAQFDKVESTEGAVGGRGGSSSFQTRKQPSTSLTPARSFRMASTGRQSGGIRAKGLASTTLLFVVAFVLWRITSIAWICASQHVPAGRDAGSATRRLLSESQEYSNVCNSAGTGADEGSIEMPFSGHSGEAGTDNLREKANWMKLVRRNRLILGSVGILLVLIAIVATSVASHLSSPSGVPAEQLCDRDGTSGSEVLSEVLTAVKSVVEELLFLRKNEVSLADWLCSENSETRQKAIDAFLKRYPSPWQLARFNFSGAARSWGWQLLQEYVVHHPEKLMELKKPQLQTMTWEGGDEERQFWEKLLEAFSSM